ncbi:MAG: Co2+/Mg2+ efflux protein ApaG [Gammaproteobacteria bacterium]|nr:Co2+/Mg2+ efflux protein ApaG [Gammaproteobacteria bacterium]
MDLPVPKIEISVKTQYLEAQSHPDEERYLFTYTITIVNHGSMAVTLRSRHWIIHHDEQTREEVFGDGVIGNFPYLKAGESYTYSSGTVMRNPIGSMEGSYDFISNDGVKFTVPIPLFTLIIPSKLH